MSALTHEYAARVRAARAARSVGDELTHARLTAHAQRLWDVMSREERVEAARLCLGESWAY